MTEKQRQYMKARQRVEETLVNPALALLNATSDLVGEYKAEAAKTESLHTTIQVLRNMNEDGQFGARVALEQIWELLHATDQTMAVANLRRLIASAAREQGSRDKASRLEFPDTTGQ